MPDLRANFKLWIYSETRAGVFGDGKVRLLEAIDRCGSLQEAARSLGISYRKAWGDLKKAEACLNTALITKRRGGQGGGHTALTAQGRQMVAWYNDLHDMLQRELKQRFHPFDSTLHDA